MSKISILGGLGHVGLPLGLFLADRGHQVTLQDRACPETDRKLVDLHAGRMPFIEEAAEELVARHWMRSVVPAYTGAASADVIIVCIGTPLDEYQNPRLEPVLRLCRDELAGLRPEQLVILRSTVFPGTTERVADVIAHPVAFCPERILQGRAIAELASLPQIVSGTDDATAEQAQSFFAALGVATVVVTPLEAELAKLLSNAWRYIQFGAANEFFRLSTDLGANYQSVYRALTENYPRCTIPTPGLSGGPCLRKDAFCLVAASPNGFPLGSAAIDANERLSDWLTRRLDIKPGMVVAICGAAFKPENDDIRDSLSYRLKKLLEFRGATVLMTDPYAKAPGLVSQEEALAQADLVIIATPHAAYRHIRGFNVVRIWEAA